ncbi:MAG: hypothetical protein LWY06_01810 [Firmicutes bacterium]|nr:hypothetical protein [Bacillota bacterium]
MPLFRDFFKKPGKVEEILAGNGCDLKRIKKVLSPENYSYIISYLEKLQDFRCVKSPVQIVSPVGVFEIPLIVESSEGFIVFFPAEKDYNEDAINQTLLLIGLVKRSFYFDSKIVITTDKPIPPVLRFFCEKNPLAAFVMVLYVNSTVVKKEKDPNVILLEDFQDAFRVKLDFKSDSLIELDKKLKYTKGIAIREVLESEPLNVALDIIHGFIEQIFRNALQAAVVESGKIKNGRTHLLLKVFVLELDFKGKALFDLKKAGHFNFYGFFEDTVAMAEDPKKLPRTENMPFIEWRVMPDQIRHIARPVQMITTLEEMDRLRQRTLDKFGNTVFCGWNDLFYCRKCNNVEMRRKYYRNKMFNTIEEMKGFLLEHIIYRRILGDDEGMCIKCGDSLNWENLVYSQVQNYLPDKKADLQLSFDRLGSGQFFYMWQMNKQDQGIRRLGVDFANKEFFANFARFMSIAAIFETLLRKCFRTNKAEIKTIEEGCHALVIPPSDENNPYVFAAFRELMKPLEETGRKFRTYVLNVDKGKKLIHKDGFNKWAAEFRKPLTYEGYQLIMLLDIDDLKVQLEKTLINHGIIFHSEGLSGFMDDGKYRLPFNYEYEAWKMVQTVRYPSEFLAYTVADFMGRFSRISDLHTWLANNFENEAHLFIDRDTGIITITPADGRAPVRINIYEFAERYMAGGPEITEIAKTVITNGKPSPGICACGDPTSFFIRLISQKKLDEVAASGNGAKPYVLNQGDKNYVFLWGCKKHLRYLTEEDLNSFEMTRQMLLSQVLEDMKHDCFELEICIEQYNNREYISIVGKDAASAGSEAHLVKAILNQCYSTLITEQALVISDCQDGLLIAYADAPADDLVEIGKRLRQRVKQKFEVLYPVSLVHKITLPSEGWGNIEISGFEIL